MVFFPAVEPQPWVSKVHRPRSHEAVDGINSEQCHSGGFDDDNDAIEGQHEPIESFFTSAFLLTLRSNLPKAISCRTTMHDNTE
jgi:hypothetical protein